MSPPPSSSGVDEDTSVVEGERASLLHAAANARTAAMLTGTHGVVAPPLDAAVVRLPAPLDLLDDDAIWEDREGESEATSLLRARAAAIGSDDPVGRLRAQLELAHAEIDDGLIEAARASAEAGSAAVDHAPAAHGLLRMLAAGRGPAAIDEQLRHVEHIAEHVSDDLVRADFLAEKGRLLEAKTGPSVDSASAYGAALALVPDHAAALVGLETALEATGRWSELAALLGRLAGLAGDAAASAWLHVERALIFDRRLGDASTARSALDRALELAPGIGPVRQATVDHTVVHRDDARLGVLLESEAALEKDAARAACLELDGALAYLHAGDRGRATKLLERAHAHGRTSKVVDARIAEELARLLEQDGRHADVLRVRKVALVLVSDARAELLALRAVAAAAERAGEVIDAVLAMERARVLDGDDATLLEELDRLLVASGRHEARAVLWMRESALADDTRSKTRALLIAAEASAAAGRDVDAARHREAAWIADPAAPGVFDALAERLAAPSSNEAVTARVALYEKAAERTADAGKRLHYLEKVAWLWDDVAGDPVRATRAYEDVLAIDPRRRSAIAGLASAATRSRDDRKLARALLAEADVIEDDHAKNEVRLRAAEALAEVEPERSLALAEDLSKSKPSAIALRARELVTRLHAQAGRWELVARSLASRAVAEKRRGVRLALALAEAAVHAQRLSAPLRALQTLEVARESGPGDPAIGAAIVSALETMGDADALRWKLEELAGDAKDPESRTSYLVRAAEIAERRPGGDDDAVRLYVLARESMPAERLVAERLRRLGARAEVPGDYVPLALTAVRSLDSGRGDDRVNAETLLADAPRDFAMLRLAERLARRARSAPQLANALALTAEASSGLLAMRALSGLAAIVAWSLPESEELAPWDRLLALGSRDAVVLDDLVRRCLPKIRARERGPLDLAIEATKCRLEGAADDTERVALRVLLGRLQKRAGAPREGAENASAALALDPTSTGAALVLAAVAGEMGDRKGAIVAATALAGVTRSGKARAALLRDAADLSASGGDAKGAAALLERALEADPDAVLVAARLAQIQAKEGAWAELARVLRRGLAAARSRDAVVPMAAELADVAKNRLRDPLLAIEALERSREISPDHVPALFLLAELYIGQRTWDEALRALGDVVARTPERSEKLIALVGRASILARVLERPADAEKELRAALMIDAHEPRALRGLLALAVPLDGTERAELLSRLVIAETNPPARLAALLELAKIRKTLGDAGGAEGALVEAAALSPDPAMLERLREAAGGDAETAARVLGRALARAREKGAAPGAAWLVSLGELELGLGRLDPAIEHFEEALQLEDRSEPVRLALARALAKKGRHETAAAALTPLLDATSTGVLDPSFVRQLEEAFTGAGRTQQALVAQELRAVAGDLDAAGTAALAKRRPMYATNSESLSGSVLRSFVMPGTLGKHVLWDAATVAASMSGKLARVGLAEQGSSSKDRVKPKAVHPVRQLFDRLARAFELFDVELAVSDHVAAPVVACEDVTWIVAPSALASWPEPKAIAALARPLARIALGIPWFGAMPPEETLAVIVAVARQAAPSFAAVPRERVEPLVADYELRARRAIDRKKRKALEDIEDALAHAQPIAVDAFADAVVRTEARAAFLLSGDLRASLAALGTTEAGLPEALRSPGRVALAAVLTRPVARDLVAFAIGGDATALRRSLGTLWG
jgi:cellulose synthase operon protein C